MPPTMPLDIWWLVCEELAERRDFNSLYSLSQVSRTMANLGLPRLYSIYELASASAEDTSIFGKQKLAILWRALILSSSGKAAFPYCLWIQNLRLGDFRELLSDMAPNRDLRKSFFQGAMEPYEMLRLSTAGPSVVTRQQRPYLDLQGIINKVGDAITLFVKEAADRDNRAVALTHLECQSIPKAILPTWTARLATLMSLHIQDGSVIGEQVALSIRDNCPKFRELTCFYCNGPTVDEDLAAFFGTIQPASLEVFSVSSQNHMGKAALAALSLHAPSLKKLGLSGLQEGAFEHIGSLRACVSLESLDLEADRRAAVNWESRFPESFADTAAWLSACTSLSSLKLWNVNGALALLKIVLRSEKLRLKSLNLKLVYSDGSINASLGKQTSLEEFYLRTTDPFQPEMDLPHHAQFIESLCKLKLLRVLDIMQTMVTYEDLDAFALALKNLEEFSFDGDSLGDRALETLTAMQKLKSININASTDFTLKGFGHFIDLVKEMHESQSGLSLMVMNQSLRARITPEQESLLSKQAYDAFGGRIEIAHPEEEHESDFSD